MRFIIQISFLALLCVVSCNQPREGLFSVRKIKPIPSVFIKSDDPQITYHQDTLYHKGTRFSGHLFSLYPNMDSAFSGTFFNGLEEGVFVKWYPNSQMAEKRIYMSGKKEGEHLGWWENGQPKFEYHFLNGEHHQALKEWFINGKPFRFFHYNMGYEEGSEKMWWENGAVRANYVVANGKKYGLIGLKICVNPYDSINSK